MEEHILSFLKKNKPQLCVLSTASTDGKPESAVMAYAVLDDLSMIISTHSTTRKWTNLKQNPRIAVTCGWNFTSLNVQYEGTATLFEQGEDYEEIKKIYYGQHPELRIFNKSTTVFLKIKPNWLRSTALAAIPPKIEEKTL